MTATRQDLINAVIHVVRAPLPPGITEAHRRETLARMCFMTAIKVGEDEWPLIWSEVMKATGCKSWRETMNKAKH